MLQFGSHQTLRYTIRHTKKSDDCCRELLDVVVVFRTALERHSILLYNLHSQTSTHMEEKKSSLCINVSVVLL